MAISGGLEAYPRRFLLRSGEAKGRDFLTPWACRY